MLEEDRHQYSCYIAIPFSEEFYLIRKAVIKGVREAGFKVVSPDKFGLLGSIGDAIPGEIAGADCIIADLTDRNPNVYFEVGLAQAMGKRYFFIAHERTLRDIPFDLRDFQVLNYDDSLKSLDYLSARIKESLREYRRFPQKSAVIRGLTQSHPFFIEWGRLDKTEIENLCHELLSQMGFQRLEWKEIPDIDLAAEFPRKDPDGFEYRELWLISMGLKMPLDFFLDIVTYNPEKYIRRVLKYSERFEKYFAKGMETPITFLLIFFDENRKISEMERFRERVENRRMERESYGYNIRLRIWDQAYLTSLVRQYPQIGYKYFSDEGRIRSKTRKSFEELYKENVDFAVRQTELISKLEEEKNKRIRAERDSVWKDISFSAAHKIGNPIFAIETDLDPLLKRVREQRTAEAEEVVANIRSSVEKAKAFVEQFKSLSRSQEIKPVSTELLPILEDARHFVCNTDIDCRIECPPGLTVFADPEKLPECFDELIENAKHWFDKPEKKIQLKVVHPIPGPLPDFLDSNKKYTLVHVIDNGGGIPVPNKQRIFDAFFTTFDHGTGLGLALVRRIIDGHGGGIIETGIPGQGADFEIYLPVPMEEKYKKKSLSKTRKKQIKE